MLYYTIISQMFLVIFSLIINVYSDVPRPRGVSLSKASLYSPAKDFTCFDGTVTVPFSYVNDDYCDCFDGSDEPGTSACLNGIFHCTNAGHRPQNIPSSRVNDGVCDCCDGTDEYANPGRCLDNCEELGKEAKAEALRIAEMHKAGSHLRLELIENGNRKRSEMEEQLNQLEKDKAEAHKIKEEKEALKNEIEAKENAALQVYRDAEEQEKQKKAEEEREIRVKESMEHFNRFDSNNDEILTKDEVKSINVFDKNKDGVVDDDEITYFFGDNESVDKETFITTTWTVLKPLLMMEQGMFKANQDIEQEEQLEDEEEAAGDHEEEYAGNEEDDSDLDMPHDDAEASEPETSSTVYDEETQKLVNEATEARQQLSEAEKILSEIESNINNIETKLEKDYGLQKEFASLDGECYEFVDNEYVYRLCLFQSVTQNSKNGGGHIGLGNWGDWVGTNNNKYSAMKYTNGQTCWNGPSRTTTVNIHCGLETKILSVSEPYRCEYMMELSTPAACDDFNLAQQSSHDEL